MSKLLTTTTGKISYASELGTSHWLLDATARRLRRGSPKTTIKIGTGVGTGHGNIGS
jgi:hypothetical protein